MKMGTPFSFKLPFEIQLTLSRPEVRKEFASLSQLAVQSHIKRPTPYSLERWHPCSQIARKSTIIFFLLRLHRLAIRALPITGLPRCATET